MQVIGNVLEDILREVEKMFFGRTVFILLFYICSIFATCKLKILTLEILNTAFY